MAYIHELMPEVLISSGGALIKYKTESIEKAEFSPLETKAMIDAARSVCGNDCEITIDTVDAHYWNYKVDPQKADLVIGSNDEDGIADFVEREGLAGR